jgi:hypothetical protein
MISISPRRAPPPGQRLPPSSLVPLARIVHLASSAPDEAECALRVLEALGVAQVCEMYGPGSQPAPPATFLALASRAHLESAIALLISLRLSSVAALLASRTSSLVLLAADSPVPREAWLDTLR